MNNERIVVHSNLENMYAIFGGKKTAIFCFVSSGNTVNDNIESVRSVERHERLATHVF